MNEAIMVTGKEQIRAVQLLAVRGALSLERMGMKHSRGSVRKGWALHYSMKPNAKIDDVILRVEAEINEINEKLGLPPIKSKVVAK